MTKAQLLATTAAQPQPAPMPKAKAAPKVKAVRKHKHWRQRQRAQALARAVDNQPDEMVPDPQVCKEFGITDMTLYRWTRDPNMGFPPPIKFSDRRNGRNFRSRRQLEAFKQRMMLRALAGTRT